MVSDMSSSSELQSLLQQVGICVGGLRKARNRFADRLAPDFSFFDYLQSDEMGLSNCLAGLLNPRGSHGQGSVFLDSFITECLGQSDWQAEQDCVEVVTEKQANGQRRIDIFLQFPNAIIGIENKPWANDQKHQLQDYANYLEKEAGGRKWILVYLCDTEPIDKSIRPEDQKRRTDEGNFIHCTFEKIEKWLDECSKQAKALQVRVFIEELSKFVRVRVRGVCDMSDEKETVAIILESNQNLQSAFDVFNAFSASKSALLENFRRELEAACQAKEYHLLWDSSMTSGWKGCSGFGIAFNTAQDIYLRFEFEGSGLNALFWGLRRSSDKTTRTEQRWKPLSDAATLRFGNGSSSEWWPWYRTNTTKNDLGLDRNWWNSAQPWLLLKNGMPNGKSVASHLVDLSVGMQQALGERSSLLLPNG